MPQTVNSSAASYLAASQYVTQVDARWIADKLSSDGVRVGKNPDGSVNLATLAAYQPLVDALMEASGLVEAACVRGARYDPTDLNALTGVSLHFLQRLVANLTTGTLLHDRRPEPGVPLTPSYLMALDWLSQLADGARIFSFAESQQAGLIADTVDTPATVCARNGVVVDARRLFGRRNNEEWRYGGRGW